MGFFLIFGAFQSLVSYLWKEPNMFLGMKYAILLLGGRFIYLLACYLHWLSDIALIFVGKKSRRKINEICTLSSWDSSKEY